MRARNNSQSFGQMVTLICSYSRLEVYENNQPISSGLNLLHRWNEMMYLLRLVYYQQASVRLIYKLGSWKKVKQINILPSDSKDIWRKKYFLNHFLILLKLGFEHIILSKMNLSNLGVLIFSKLHWILAFLENCCECADFIITNGKKSRNQRLINFASSGYFLKGIFLQP